MISPLGFGVPEIPVCEMTAMAAISSQYSGSHIGDLEISHGSLRGFPLIIASFGLDQGQGVSLLWPPVAKERVEVLWG